MSLVADLIRESADRLRRDLVIDADLETVAAASEPEQDPALAAKTARRMLRDRIQALEVAQAELKGLTRAIGHLRVIAPHTQEGWPQTRDELRALMRDDGPAGVREWLKYWFAGAAWCRQDALNWLLTDVELPAGAELVAERARWAAVGLEQRNWELAAPMLAAGAFGLVTGEAQIPGRGVRSHLRLLLGRLALELGRLEDADLFLAGDGETEHVAAFLALQARRHRLANDTETAASLLSKAREYQPSNLDVAMEVIHEARSTDQADAAMDAARIAVDALRSLLDIDHDLGRLLTPPAELWIAVSDRAAREDSPELARRALAEAMRLTAPEHQGLLAVIGERQANVLTGRERLQALIEAGEHRIGGRQFELARADFDQVLVGAGDEEGLRAVAAIRFGDCVSVATALEPLKAVRAEVNAALAEVVRAQTVDNLSTAESWSYLIEADLRMRLADAADDGRADQLWRAFLAAARAVALSPSDPARWNRLADVTSFLDCPHSASIFAERARVLGGDTTDFVRALVDAGRTGEAIDLLAAASDPWSQSVRGYCLLRQDKAAEVVRLLTAVTIDPTWMWAQAAFVSALLISGHAAAAEIQASTYKRRIAGRTDEYSCLLKAAQWEQVHGDLDVAVGLAQLARDVATNSREVNMILGSALVLRGHADRGWATIVAGLSSYQSWELEDWRRIDWPQLQELARLRGVPLSYPSVIPKVIGDRRRQLASPFDPVMELRQCSAANANADVVALARNLGQALVLMARQDEAAEDALALIGPDGAREADALRADLHRPAAPVQAAEIGTEATPSSPIAAADVDQVRVELPSSWFEDYEDPVRQHELFVRYLPQLRVDHRVPPVRVIPEDELNPDRFRIHVGEQLVREGRIQRSARYCSEAALAFLPPGLQLKASPDPSLGTQQLPADAVADGDGWVELMTRPGTELLAALIGETAERVGASG